MLRAFGLAFFVFLLGFWLFIHDDLFHLLLEFGLLGTVLWVVRRKSYRGCLRLHREKGGSRESWRGRYGRKAYVSTSSIIDPILLTI